jgi:RecA/RadA recombinase
VLSLHEVSSKLQGVRFSGPDKLTARCPAHDDKSSSLSLGNGNKGIVINCFAGCKAEDVLDALALKWSDVMPDREIVKVGPKTEKVWQIKDVDGNLVAEHVRIDQDGTKRFVWRRNGKSGLDGFPVVDVPLYRSEHLGASDYAFVTEGEKSADAAAKLGLVAVGTTCGANATPSPNVLGCLKGRKVILWPDNDPAGKAHMQKVADALEGIAASVKWLQIPNAGLKHDAADYTGTLEELRGYVQSDKPKGPLVHFKDAIKDAAKELDRVFAGDLTDYVQTGIPSLDRKLNGGLRYGETVLIGGATGSGKTAVCVKFAMEAQKKGACIIVSPEMTARGLVTREIVRRSGFQKWEASSYVWSAANRQKAAAAHMNAAAELAGNPPNVLIYDALALTLQDVREAIRGVAKTQKVSYVALDYAQQIAEEGDEKARYRQVGEVALLAIEVAREHHCAVVITSQVNVGKDGSNTIRESKNLENKADIVLFFIVDRDERGDVKEARFVSTKYRDGGHFKLNVSYKPEIFEIMDQQAEVYIEEIR